MSSYSSPVVSPPATTAPCDWLTIAEASREYRLSKSVLRKWDRLGKLKAYRVAANTLSHRRYLRRDLELFLGYSSDCSREDTSGENTGPAKVIICARCSTSKQAEDLKRQVQRLETYAAENYSGRQIHRYVRTASGLNYQNKTFVRMIQDIVSNKFNGAVLLITHKERLIRFGFEMVKVICDAHNVKIIQTEDEEDKNYITELTEDILAITHIASCKLYGKRGTRKSGASNPRPLPPSLVDHVNDQLGQGYSVRTIFARLKQTGENLYADGKSFSIQIVRRLSRLFKNNSAASLALVSKPVKQSFESWLKERLRAGGPGSKVRRSHILKAYSDYCQTNGLKKVSRKLAQERIAKHVQNLNVQTRPCGENAKDCMFIGLNFFDKHSGAVHTAKPA